MRLAAVLSQDACRTVSDCCCCYPQELHDAQAVLPFKDLLDFLWDQHVNTLYSDGVLSGVCIALGMTD